MPKTSSGISPCDLHTCAMTQSAMTVAQSTKGYDICGATNRAGKPCTRPAGWGTDHARTGHCKLHGGSTGSGKKHAAMLTARAQLERLTTEPLTPDQYIDPIGALLGAVTEASMVVAYLREQVMSLDVGLVSGEPTWTHMLRSTTRDGTEIELGEEERALVKLYGEWHDRLVRAAKACAAAKIDERVTKLAEAQGARLDAAFRLFMRQMAEMYPGVLTADILAAMPKVFAGAFRELTPKLLGTSG